MALKPPDALTLPTSSRVDVLFEAPLNVQYPEFGAKGDNSTDDTAAIQAALTLAAVPSRGTVYFPPATYRVAGSIDCGTSVSLKGEGGRRGPVRVNYEGAGTFITNRGATGVHHSGLYVTGFSDAACLLDMSNVSGPGVGLDSTLNSVKDCWFASNARADSPTVAVKLGQCTATEIDGCYFQGGHTGILGNTSTSGYSNSNHVTNCYFDTAAVAAIRNAGQAWSIRQCTFEPLFSGAAGAVVTDVGYAVQGVAFSGNSYQDADATGNWVVLRGSGATFLGDTFFLGDVFIKIIGDFDGFTVKGCTLGTLGYYATTASVDLGAGSVTNFEMSGNAGQSTYANSAAIDRKSSLVNRGGGFEPIGFVNINAGSAPNNTLFRDAADNVLKFRDNAGTLHALY